MFAVAYYIAILMLIVVPRIVGRTRLIISIGVTATDALFLITRVASGLAVAAGLVYHIKGLLKKHKARLAAKKVENLAAFPLDKAIDTAAIREELSRQMTERPKLSNILAQVLSQMDSMDRKQAKLNEILVRNNNSTLGEAVSTLDAAEQTLCRNTLKILNRVLLWDTLEADNPGKKALYEEHENYFRKTLATNDKILTMCDTLLVETACYLNERSSGVDDGSVELEAMTSVIRSLRGMTGEASET
jgi:hypothetical protein